MQPEYRSNPRRREKHPGCPAWILECVRRIRESATQRPAMPDKTQQAIEPKE